MMNSTNTTIDNEGDENLTNPSSTESLLEGKEEEFLWTRELCIEELLKQWQCNKSLSKKFAKKLDNILDNTQNSYRSLIYQKELSQIASSYVMLERIKLDIIDKLNKLSSVEEGIDHFSKDLFRMLASEETQSEGNNNNDDGSDNTK